MIGEHFVDVDGINTRYLQAGEAGPPLVLVHGGHFGRGASADDWGPVLPRLAERFRVFALDKIGCGHTDNPVRDEDYVINATVRHLIGFIRALDLGAVHLAGHSRGGYGVVRAALEAPEIARSITVVASATLIIPPNPIYQRWQEEARAIADPRERIRHLTRANSHSGDHITDDFIDARLAIDELPKTRAANEKMQGGLWQRFKDDLVAQQEVTWRLIGERGLPAPTLVLWGTADPSARLDPIGFEAMRRLLPAAPRAEAHLFTHAGHYIFREQADRFADVLSDFVIRSEPDHATVRNS